VLTDEQLVERIKSSLKAEVANVRPPADLLARIRLEYAADEHEPGPPLRWLPRPSLSGVISALAAGLAVAVAVLAIVLIGHYQATSRPSATVPAQARPLVSLLAVLRRPQTAADRGLPAWAIRGQTFGDSRQNPLPTLTRLAATLPGLPSGGVRIFLIVQPATSLKSSNPRGPSRLGVGARVAALIVSHTGEDGTHSVTAAQLYQPVNMFPGTGPGLFQGPGYNVGIVPDGVMRVRWVFDGRYAFAKKHRRPFAIYPAVHNNVAIARIVRNQGFVSSVTWYGANGRVIKQTR
jgi:hypothetical protein